MMARLKNTVVPHWIEKLVYETDTLAESRIR
jgi:hypothetical protein